MPRGQYKRKPRKTKKVKKAKIFNQTVHVDDTSALSEYNNKDTQVGLDVLKSTDWEQQYYALRASHINRENVLTRLEDVFQSLSMLFRSLK